MLNFKSIADVTIVVIDPVSLRGQRKGPSHHLTICVRLQDIAHLHMLNVIFILQPLTDQRRISKAVSHHFSEFAELPEVQNTQRTTASLLTLKSKGVIILFSEYKKWRPLEFMSRHNYITSRAGRCSPLPRGIKSSVVHLAGVVAVTGKV